eukprot:TRINITY_DN4517_c1_g1_i1.p1 TRINITY_DN4517_c1_g1~~TRINITY_DN4517_c1_g1_i1.p1  ORF type:complete len:1137 (+),score=335.80 TRINITY_DN4517_c1_g1_i1:43-3411(+)
MSAGKRSRVSTNGVSPSKLRRVGRNGKGKGRVEVVSDDDDILLSESSEEEEDDATQSERGRFDLMDDEEDVGLDDGEDDDDDDAEEEEPQYRMGNVVRVSMHNFTTYEDCEFRPGPRLNVVVGPNGTGKSTIVNALGLGLGGNCSLLGRAEQVGEFVQRGKDDGWVEIELAGKEGGRNVVVKRKIFRKDNKSLWWLNNKSSSQKEVKAKMKQMKVQVENLCQFLPQDRVVEFAKLDPSELLIETEKALGRDQAVKLHEQLCVERTKEKELQQTFDAEKKELESLVAHNAHLKSTVERCREREVLQQKVSDLEQKRPWVLFEKDRAKALEYKEKFQAKSKALKREQKRIGPFERKLTELQEEGQALLAEKNELKGEGRKLTTTLERLKLQNERYEEEYEQSVNDFKNVDKTLAQQKRKIVSKRNECVALEAELTQLEVDVDGANQQEVKREINEEVAKHEKTLVALDQKMGDVRMEMSGQSRAIDQANRELQQITNTTRRRLAEINKFSRESVAARNWLDQNRQRFAGRVYGPIALEINVSNDLHARLIRECTGATNQRAFVFENSDDRDLFDREMHNMKIDKLTMLRPESRDPAPRHPLNEATLQEHGLKWLDDLYEAPDIVRVVLNSMAGHDSVVVCESSRHAGNETELMDQLDIRMMVTPEGVYRGKRSAYGERSLVTNFSHMRPGAAVQFSGVDHQQKERAEAQLKEAQDGLNNYKEQEAKLNLKHSEANNNLQQQRKRYLRIEQADKSRSNLRRKISERKKMVDALEKEVTSAAPHKTRLKMVMKTALKKRVGVCHKAYELMKKMADVENRTVDVAIRRSAQSSEQTRAQDHVTKCHEFLKGKRDQVAEFQALYHQFRASARTAQQVAHRTAPLTDELKEMFKTLPDTIEALEAELNIARTRAEATADFDPELITTYEKRKETIDRLNRKVEDKEAVLAGRREEIETMHNEWYPLVKGMIDEINSAFSGHFREMGLEGKVLLREHEDYDKYGVEIMVSFRQKDELQVLDSHKQSGGERSVSTMLYLISLQDITECPFRLVDEINQGMDPRNERMVFDIIVESATQPDRAQYFLITPKLLPNLPFTNMMTVLCIFNGPWNLTSVDWNERWKDGIQSLMP